MNQKINMMRHVPLFRYLSDEELTQLSRIVTRRSLNKGTILYFEGAKRQSFYYVHKGLIKTYKQEEGKDKPTIKGYYKKGDVFPHIGFIQAPNYETSAACIVQTEVLVLPISPLKQLLTEYPAMSIKLIEALGQRIKQMHAMMQNNSSEFPQHNGKLFLLKLAEHMKTEKRGQDIRIGIPMTYQELAETIGSSREQARRFIMRLREGGIVDMQRTGFIIHDVEALRQWQES